VTIDKIKSPEESQDGCSSQFHPEEISHPRIELVDGTILTGFVARDRPGRKKLWPNLAVPGHHRRKRLEAQLIPIQKMETVGQLAGGVAHEFNSIPDRIIGQSDCCWGDLPEGRSRGQKRAEIAGPPVAPPR